MTNTLLRELLESLRETWPKLSAAAFDTEEKLILSVPDPLKHPLPSVPQDPRFSKGNTFMASIDVPDHGVLSFGGKAGSRREAEEIFGFAKSLCRALLEKESSYWHFQLERDLHSAFLNSLFTVSGEEDASYVRLFAKSLGLELDRRRAVILICLDSSGSSAKHPDRALWTLPDQLALLPFFGPQDLLGWTGESRLIALKTLQGTASVVKAELQAGLLAIRRMLADRWRLSARISVSTAVDSTEQYSAALTAAQRALNFTGAADREPEIIFFEDYLLEAEVAQLPRKALDHFFAPHISALRETVWMRETLEALIRSEMRMDEAANLLFIHRNTLSFRLKQIRKLLHLDPVNRDSDYFTIHVLCIYLQLYRPLAEEAEAGV